MSKRIKLKEIEGKIYQIEDKDGFLCLWIGIEVLASGLLGIWWFIDYFIIPIVIISIIISFIIFKKYVTWPRIGRVRFGKFMNLKIMLLAIISVISTIILVILKVRIFPDDILMALFLNLLFLPLLICCFALVSGYKRLYIFALLFGLNFCMQILLFLVKIPEPFYELIPCVIVSLIFMVMWGAILYKFLKQYPLPNNDNK